MSNQINKSIPTVVLVDHVYYEYKHGITVLKDVNLNVPGGKIFALLGPNGTGKTTLILLLLARLSIISGRILIYGYKPGKKELGIPGPNVGYMPQDLALFKDLTIDENLRYYSMIYKISENEYKNSFENLYKLFENLPEKDRKVIDLSGGQKRCVSLAITLIHRPKLIILDEPTVGMDSLLRRKLWNYLEECCHKYDQTVIITTHYIEEARCAHNVAFMHSGTILEQSNPEVLIERYNSITLEEVFLRLCYDEKKILSIHQDHGQTLSDFSDKYDNFQINLVKTDSISFFRIKAIMKRLWISIHRETANLALFYIIPFAFIMFMNLTLGKYPRSLPMAIFNGDIEKNLSIKFIENIDENKLKITEYNDKISAINSVSNGVNYISLEIVENFSNTIETIFKKFSDIKQLDNLIDENNSSIFKLNIDFSNPPIASFILLYILQSFLKFSDSIQNLIGFNLFRNSIPLNTEEIIYGSFHWEQSSFFAPSALIIGLETTITVMVAIRLVVDKSSSSLERTFVAGVTRIEYLLAYFIVFSFLSITQILYDMFLSLLVFQNIQLGSNYELFLILYIHGCFSIMTGFLISTLFDDIISVLGTITFMGLPLWLISGVFWPLEALPSTLRKLMLYLSPMTYPLISLRSIMLRGLTYQHYSVFYGYVSGICFTILITVLNIIFLGQLK